MRVLLLFCFLCALTSPSFAQLGIQTSAVFNETRRDFPEINPSAPPLYEWRTGSELALNYWFRLKNHRVEFLPTVFYARADTERNNTAHEFGLQFKTNIYLFDLAGDCDCPTFGKQGPQLQKGFFVQLAPGYSRYAFELTTSDQQDRGAFHLGAAVGIDFGVSNLLTLTPIAGLRYGLGNFVPEMDITDVNGLPIGTYSPRLVSYQIGLLVGFRFDHRRY